MRITSVEVTPVAVPYRPEFGTVVTAATVLTEARHLIVKVNTDEGVSGYGEALERPAAYGETIESVIAALQKLVVPRAIGTDPHDTEKLWARWSHIAANTTAKSAVEVACWDIVGRVAALPLYKLLGGHSDGTIPLTMPLAIAADAEVVRQATEAVALGFRSIKLKVGKDLARDLRVTAAVRDAIGADVMLYVDANRGYSLADALRAVAVFEQLDVALLEDPVPVGAVDARVRIAGASRVGLLIDETVERPSDALREIRLGTAAAFSIRSPRSGIGWSAKLIGMAEAAGVPCLAGSHRELGVGTAASAHLQAAFAAMSLPAELGVHTTISDGLLVEPIAIADGRLTLPDAPGLGVDVDPDKLNRYRTADTIEITA